MKTCCVLGACAASTFKGDAAATRRLPLVAGGCPRPVAWRPLLLHPLQVQGQSGWWLIRWRTLLICMVAICSRWRCLLATFDAAANLLQIPQNNQACSRPGPALEQAWSRPGPVGTGKPPGWHPFGAAAGTRLAGKAPSGAQEGSRSAVSIATAVANALWDSAADLCCSVSVGKTADTDSNLETRWSFSWSKSSPNAVGQSAASVDARRAFGERLGGATLHLPNLILRLSDMSSALKGPDFRSKQRSSRTRRLRPVQWEPEPGPGSDGPAPPQHT